MQRPEYHHQVVALLGTAPCWESDLAELCKAVSRPMIAAVNRHVRWGTSMDWFFTCHPEKFVDDVARLRAKGMDFSFVSTDRFDGVDTLYRPRMELAYGGTVAYAMCYLVSRGKRVVLCGCPFDESGHANDPSTNEHAYELWDWFMRGHPSRAGVNVNVRSMSGRTRELLGYPDGGFLT